MPAYRFCRTDDIPLLTDALNACYFVHFPDQPPLSLADFKREIRELNIWASSCMVASEDGEAIAVITGAKREHETLIHRVGVRRDFQRRGHAKHLVESLCHKLSVLGPPKIVVEIEDEATEVRDLFEAVGFSAGEELADFVLAEPLVPSRDEQEILEVGLDDLLRDRMLDTSATRSWERALDTLQNRKDQMHGRSIALGSPSSAYALFRDLRDCGKREIVALGAGHCADGVNDNLPAELECVIRAVCQAGPAEATIPRISRDEVPWTDLEALGFRKMQTYTRYTDFPDSRIH